MNFINTMNLLSQQAKGKQIPLEAALELIRTYLTELRHHTGSSVEKCPMEDRAQAAANLAAVSNDMNYIFQYHKKSFTEEQDRYAQALTRANGYLENHSREMSQLLEQINTYEALNQKLEVAVQEQTKANEDLAGLRQQQEKLEQQLKEFDTADPESEVGKLQAQIREQSETLARQTAQFDADRQRLAALVQQVGDLEARYQSQTEELAQREARLQELDVLLEAIVQKTEETEDKQQALAEAQQRLQQHTEALEQLNVQMTDGEEQLQALTEQEAQAQTDLAQVQSHCASLQQQLDDLTARIAGEQQHLETLQQQLTDSEANSEQKRQTVAALEKSIAEEQAYTTGLLNRLEELEMALSAKQTDNRMFREGHVEPMQRKLDEATAQGVADRQQLPNLNLELEQKETERQTIAGESMLLQSQISKKEKQLQQQRSQHEDLKTSIDTMETQLREMANAWSPLLNREKELQQRLDSKNVEQLQEEISSGIRRLEAENAKADEMEQQLVQLKPQLAQLEEKVKQLAAELDRSTASEETLSQQYGALQRRLEEITSPANRQRSQHLSNQLDLMRRILKNLSPDGRSDNVTTEDLRLRMDQAEQTLSRLRKAALDYTTLREQSLEGDTMI